MLGSKRHSQTGDPAGIMSKQQSFNWRELADKGACVPNTMYVSRADVTYDAVAADKMTKCCNLRKKMLQAAGLVIVIVIFFLLPYFAVKVATISADVAKLSEELAILSDTMAKLSSMTQLRFARLEREIVS